MSSLLQNQNMVKGFSFPESGDKDRHTLGMLSSESFRRMMFEIVDALCWDRDPFHAPGVYCDLREIR